MKKKKKKKKKKKTTMKRKTRDLTCFQLTRMKMKRRMMKKRQKKSKSLNLQSNGASAAQHLAFSTHSAVRESRQAARDQTCAADSPATSAAAAVCLCHLH